MQRETGSHITLDPSVKIEMSKCCMLGCELEVFARFQDTWRLGVNLALSFSVWSLSHKLKISLEDIVKSLNPNGNVRL